MKKAILIALGLFLIANITNAQGVNFYRDLSVGMSGDDVTELQTWLISNGFDIPAISSGSASKGYFGMQTKMAVIKMQAANGIPNTGYVGQLTRGKLKGGQQGNALIVVSPNGGEQLVRNTTATISWTGSPGILNKSGSIKLMPRVPDCAIPKYPGGPVCLIAVHEPYPISSNISLFKKVLDWTVGGSELVGCSINGCIPDGDYKIQICSNDSSVCDTSDNYFSIGSTNTTNKAPAINGIQAPTTLKVGELGTWRVSALDPQNSTLTYNVSWGDISAATSCPAGYACTPDRYGAVTQQGSTFTHSYSQPGTYNILFTVTNSAGLTTSSTVTVKVTGNTTSSNLRVMSPNGGQNWTQFTTQRLTWVPTSNQYTYVDLYLDKTNMVCADSPCGQTWVLDRNIGAYTFYDWIVATDIDNKTIPAGDYKLRVCAARSTTDCDSSDSHFTISSNSGGPLTVTSPNGGESWKLGSNQTIRWTSPQYFRATNADVKLVSYYDPSSCPRGYTCLPSPQRVYILSSNLPINQNSLTWTVGQFYSVNIKEYSTMSAGQYTIQVCEAGTANCDSSNAPFTITN